MTEEASKQARVVIELTMDIENVPDFIRAWKEGYADSLTEYAGIDSATIQIPETTMQLRRY